MTPPMSPWPWRWMPRWLPRTGSWRALPTCRVSSKCAEIEQCRRSHRKAQDRDSTSRLLSSGSVAISPARAAVPSGSPSRPRAAAGESRYRTRRGSALPGPYPRDALSGGTRFGQNPAQVPYQSHPGCDRVGTEGEPQSRPHQGMNRVVSSRHCRGTSTNFVRQLLPRPRLSPRSRARYA